MRIGLMGCGVVADFGHLPAIAATHGLELVALFDPILARAEVAASTFGGRAFDDSESFFAMGLDAVVVTSPAPAHRQNVLDAARHGLHVLCEKPIAMDDGEGEEMIAAMASAGKMLLVGFVYRFSPVARQFKQWLDDGVIGELRALRTIYIWNLHGQYEQDAHGAWVESPRFRGRMLEGGPMVDCGVHQVDLCRYWTGREVAGLSAAGSWVLDGYEAPDALALHMAFEGGVSASVEVSFSYGHTAKDPRAEFSYHAIGTGGVLRYDREGYILEARNGEGTIQVPGASEKNFRGMYEEFLAALWAGEPGGFPTAMDGLLATRIARAATEEAIAKRVR